MVRRERWWNQLMMEVEEDKVGVGITDPKLMSLQFMCLGTRNEDSEVKELPV